MNAYVAVTDQDWYDFLSRQLDLDEVNFWTPTPWGGAFNALRRGELLLFKLKSPLNAIAGGGFFEHYTELPVSFAWDAFGVKNGADSLQATHSRISRLRRDQPAPWEDYSIGCIILVEPFFWPPGKWIPQPRDFSPRIVRGKGYDLLAGTGRELWERIRERLDNPVSRSSAAERNSPDIPGGFGDPTWGPRRIGQGTFRVVITDVYHRRCAVTAERALPALEAAHIRPFRELPLHYVTNGLLLRSDLHRLFDKGYVTVTPDYRTEVSRRIREDFHDGESYLSFHGRRIFVPERSDYRPDPAMLTWHNENRFRS